MSVRKVNFVNIPQELKQNASFCVWKLEKRNGKPTKVPYNPKNGQLARTNDPGTFSDFGTVMKAYAMGGWDGIGFRVSEGIGAIDIDHCIREDGSLNDVAASVLGFFPDTYFERSPSGSGLRGFFRLAPDFAYDKTVYYQQDSDRIAQFISQCLRKEKGQELKPSAIYNHYKTWCSDNGYKYEGSQNFYKRLALSYVITKRRPWLKTTAASMNPTQLVDDVAWVVGEGPDEPVVPEE